MENLHGKGMEILMSAIDRPAPGLFATAGLPLHFKPFAEPALPLIRVLSAGMAGNSAFLPDTET